MMYAVTAIREYTPRVGGWESSGEQLPTFFLDSTVQGITSEGHAKAIALDLLGDGARIVAVVAL